MTCKLIKNLSQFKEKGCENGCFRNNDEWQENTTAHGWQGIISMMRPKESWVAKWNNIGYQIPDNEDNNMEDEDLKK